MQLSKKQAVWIIVIVMISPIILWLLFWLSILLSNNLYTHQLSQPGLWPVICSNRSCVTTSAWHKHYQSRKIFAEAVNEEPPTPEKALTTLARQHLVDKAKNSWPVSLTDARRYREEVLQNKSKEKIKQTTGLTLEEYDKYVVLPLLKQEILRTQMQAENFDAMFKQLARQRALWALPRGLIWDRESAKVIKQ